jgi:thiol-disulfide isomerase/thioredoxin
MGVALLLARMLLAGVFAVSGVAKLSDLRGSRATLGAFGVPGWAAAPGAVLLPLAELALATLLLPVATARPAAIGVLALLAVFCAAIGGSLWRGRRPACHCFGRLSAGPIGARTLLRNLLLALPAVFVVAGGQGGGADLFSLQGGTTMAATIGLALGAGTLALAVVALWLLLQLLAQNGRLLTRLDALDTRLATGGGPAAPAGVAPAGPGLAVGTPAPGFALTGLFGERLTLDALRAAGKPVLLTFVDPGCGPCTALLPDLARWQRELAGVLSLALISAGTAEANRAKLGDLGLTQVLLQEEREVSTAYQAFGTPSAVLVRPDGTIGSALAQGAEQIGALVARTMGQPAPQPPLPVVQQAVQPAAAGQPCPQCGKVHEPVPAAPQGAVLGTPVPPLTLPDLDGRPVELSGPRDEETVLLLWNPGCGFCQQLLPELKAWEAHRPAGAPALVVVSTGERAANAAHGLLSPVLLQQGFEAGAALGLSGTPSALLVDRAGRIASAPAVGGPAVMALLGAAAVA